ncbi:MAG TPA: DUF2071 domain-containing protein [Terriglobales bacterium]|nr:DUF2071 domain-containing protein [Terriglobales bacterium]
MNPALESVAHRPWPLPSGPWVMAQSWHDLLFAHWPIAPRTMRPLIPPQLELDIFDKQCWVGVVPFRMSGVRARGFPAIVGTSRFPELNVRTYVTYGGKRGVYFFSLDAANRLAVKTARLLYHLPYFYAEMGSNDTGDEIVYRSKRKHGEAEFRGRYRAVSAVQVRAPHSLEHWLTERYCLYAVFKEKVYRGEIHHQPWPLQDGSADISVNTLATAANFELPDTKALLHFARRLDVLIWPLRRVS